VSAPTGWVPTPGTTPTAVATRRFAVPARQVWAFRLDFAHLPAYNPDVTGVEQIGDGSGPGGALGSGARFRFSLADPRRPERSHPVELWTVAVVEPSLVAAGMKGGADAYEEFVVRADGDAGCQATLTLWLSMADGLPPETTAAIAANGLQQIEKELDLMKVELEGNAGAPSVH
jgi:hypothetical protein